MVPSTWRDAICQTSIRSPKGETPYRGTDIFIKGSAHPVHGLSPYTQQSQSECGKPGDYTAFHHSFFSGRLNDTKARYGNPAKLFVHEWSKLRYGIFEETGYNHDIMYPSHFLHQGKVLPTGATNVPVKGTWVHLNGQPECDPLDQASECFFLESGDNSKVTCSLGYLPSLRNATTFCDSKHVMNMPMAPTKHNILCNGLSSKDVILSHEDFSRLGNLNSKKSHKRLDPAVTVVREPEPQYVLVMETIEENDNAGQWKWISKAAQKFIRYDLSIDSNLGIVTFANTSKIEHPMTRIRSNDVRSKLADTIPDKYHLSRSSKTGSCLLCAVRKVLHNVLNSDTMAGTHLVLLVSSLTKVSPKDERILRNYVQDYNIKISVILLNPESNKDLESYDTMTEIMGGETYPVSMSAGPMEFFVTLTEAFTDVIRSDSRYPTELPTTVHRQANEGSQSETSGSFLMDSSMGRDTVFGLFVEDEEEHGIKEISFTDSVGKRYGPFDRMSSSFDLVNFKTINFPSGREPPFNAVSN